MGDHVATPDLLFSMHSNLLEPSVRRHTVWRVRLAVLLVFSFVARLTSPSVVLAQPTIANTGNSASDASPLGTFVALSVPDLEASARWYERTFGLTRVMTVPRTGAIAGVVALEGSGLIVELIQHDSARVATERPELTHGIAKAGFIVDDFDATIAMLESRGVVFFSGPYPARPGVRANAMFRDNAGNVWQVFGKRG